MEGLLESETGRESGRIGGRRAEQILVQHHGRMRVRVGRVAQQQLLLLLAVLLQQLLVQRRRLGVFGQRMVRVSGAREVAKGRRYGHLQRRRTGAEGHAVRAVALVRRRRRQTHPVAAVERRRVGRRRRRQTRHVVVEGTARRRSRRRSRRRRRRSRRSAGIGAGRRPALVRRRRSADRRWRRSAIVSDKPLAIQSPFRGRRQILENNLGKTK